MAATEENVLQRVYRNRIREPRTDDEVYGYWIFVAGILVGLLGLFFVIGSDRATTERGLGVAVLGIALLTLMLGSIVRLELQRKANLFAILGALVGLVAIVWFWSVYPSDWQFGTQQVWNVIGLGSAGIGLMVIAAVIIPLVTDPSETELAAQQAAHEDAMATSGAAHEEAMAEAEAAHEEQLAESEAAREAAESQARDANAALEDAHARIADMEASQAQFELYEDKAGDYRWRLRHRNSNVIADGGQGYASRRNAQQGLGSVKRNAFGAAVVDVESTAADISEADEDAEGPDAPPVAAEVESQATIETYEDNAGQHRWRLRHDNGNVIADSGEGYASRRNLDNAVDRIGAYALDAPYLRIEPTAFELYQDDAGDWRWRLVHENGNILADGGQGYSSRTAARDGADSVRRNADGGNAEFEVYEDDAGEHRWRLRHDNGEVIADSGEGYASKSNVEDAVERIENYAPDADLLAIGGATFEIYEDAGEEWRWRLRHRNGNILADSGQGYTERNDAVEAVTKIKLNLPNAPVEAAAD